MKRYLIQLIILNVFACSNPQDKETEQQNPQENNIVEPEITQENIATKIEGPKFKETNMQAVLIGNNIELLDNELKTIDNISNLSGDIIELTAVSDSLFNQSKDICDAFWYVKIKGADKEGIVNGRQVFKIVESKQDTSFTVNGNQIKILTTEFLGMGVNYQGELMGCPVDQPVLIRDTKNDFYGLIDLIPNEYSKKASWDNEYSFFELRSDDGAYDQIDSITTDGQKIRLKIHRSFQEGENDYEVLLSFDNDKYIAEYLNFGEVKYE